MKKPITSHIVQSDLKMRFDFQQLAQSPSLHLLFYLIFASNFSLHHYLFRKPHLKIILYQISFLKFSLLLIFY
jgi:hypothetical protein